VTAPPKEKPPLGGRGLRKLTYQIRYQTLRFWRGFSGAIFWKAEQAWARMEDEEAARALEESEQEGDDDRRW
jgi:hypothetical protein